MDLSELKLGLLCLGIFVGFLLGFALMKSNNQSIKSVLTVLGAALAGAPVAFMTGVEQKWMYPVGLLVGLLYTRVFAARNAIAMKVANPEPENKVHGIFAWIDLIVISIVTISAILYGIVSE